MDDIIPLDTHNHCILIGGRPHMGKSTLIKAIIRHYKDVVRYVIVLTGSKQNKDYAKYVNKYIYDASEQAVDTILSITKHMIENGNENRVLLILDDVQDLSFYGKPIKRLVSFHRHHKLDIVFALQSLSTISPLVRNNCNIVFLTAQDEDKIVHQLYLSYGKYKRLTEQEFVDMLQDATSLKYRMLCFTKDNEVEPYHYVKVENIEPFFIEN